MSKRVSNNFIKTRLKRIENHDMRLKSQVYVRFLTKCFQEVEHRNINFNRLLFTDR